MWGYNNYGQLGVYSNADSKIPIKVNNSSSTLPEKSVKYVALGYYHSAAITKMVVFICGVVTITAANSVTVQLQIDTPQ